MEPEGQTEARAAGEGFSPCDDGMSSVHLEIEGLENQRQLGGIYFMIAETNDRSTVVASLTAAIVEGMALLCQMLEVR